VHAWVCDERCGDGRGAAVGQGRAGTQRLQHVGKSLL
jgi:hypothetical protein